jgi:hypothetical protein
MCFTFVIFASCVPPTAMSVGWGWEAEGSSVVRETGGQAQFDWMLDGGLMAQPIGSQLDSFF